MQLSWFGRPKSTQVDVSRPRSTEFLFSWTFFLISQTVPPADSGSLTRFVSIRCNCIGFGRLATDCVGVFPFCRPLHACVRRRFLAVFYRYRKMKNGQPTDAQRPSLGFRYSFVESHGFSRSEETQLISDTIIAQDLGPQGATLPEYAGQTHLTGRELSRGSQFSNQRVCVWRLKGRLWFRKVLPGWHPCARRDAFDVCFDVNNCRSA